MSTVDTRDDEASNGASSIPGESTPAQAKDDQDQQGPSRAELKDRALESRNSYVTGELPGEQEGAEIDGALRREAEDESSSLGVAFQFLVLDDIPDNERISALQEHSGGKLYRWLQLRAV
ncbi:MAG: hypothetical protein OXN95_09830 [bacterium]|nr:hypothetical protein [bacterium]